MRQHTCSSTTRSYPLLIAAILLGLSWIGLVYAAKYLAPIYTFSSDWWLNASLWRLLLGFLLFLVLIPLLLRRQYPDDSYGRITGFELPRTKLAYTLAGLFILLPPLVTFWLQGGLGSLPSDYDSPLKLLANLQPALIEEVMMRGLFVYLMFKAGFHHLSTITIGALIFASWHVLSFGMSGLLTGVLCIPLMYLPRFITGGIFIPIILHVYTNSGLLNAYSITAILLIEVLYGIWWYYSLKKS
jgi:hypothetical protein